jgi:hypothetical protein
MTKRIVLAIAVALLLMRLPSIVQPMGGDQALYAYVGDRIRAGGLPYRDAWDQKPPAIHFLYAGMRTLWTSDAVVPAADIAAAAAVAWLVYRIGAAEGPAGSGAAASLLFLFLSNPSLTRLAGTRLRSQCETFIAVAVAGALLILLRRRRSRVGAISAGILLGLAFTFKYNTAVFAPAAVGIAWLVRRISIGDVVRMAAGFAIPVAVVLAIFAIGGALRPLIDATIFYNLQYSGETYGTVSPLQYLLTFPIERARVDALWTLGGAGCLLLLAGAAGSRDRLVPVVWVAAACASIAINGSRSLPQYFIQANPGLALAAGWAGALAWQWIASAFGRRARLVAIATTVIVLAAVWRVVDAQLPKLVEQTMFDARRALGVMPRDVYLARFDDDRKYSAIGAATLGGYLKAHSAPDQPVFVFGFTCGAYVEAGRASASRFFWSRPVIAGFNAGVPGYGAEGLLSELQINRPSVVALQQKDWAPDVEDSAAFFMRTPRLAGWLQAYYVRAAGPEGFDIWLRRAVP